MILMGIQSGDCECWCFLVDYKTFVEVKKEKPSRWDLGRFRQPGSPYRYMLYPNDLFGWKDGEVITIHVESGIKVPTVKATT